MPIRAEPNGNCVDSDNCQSSKFIISFQKYPKISIETAIGITRHATRQSVNASEVKNRFVVLRKCLSRRTAMQTRLLPQIVDMITKRTKIGTIDKWKSILTGYENLLLMK